MIYLANQLHITVFDTIVHHLDVVTSTFVTDPVTASLAIRLGCDALEDLFDVWPGLLVTTGHERWTISGTLLTTGNTGSDEVDTLLGEVLGTTVGVRVVRVTTINDDITLLDVGQQLLDEIVHGRTGHDEQHDTSRSLELHAELLDGVSTDDGFALQVSVWLCNAVELLTSLRTLCLILEEAVDLGNGSVEGNDREAVVGGVQDQVLTHDGQADETKISTSNDMRGSTDIDAGQTRTNVSEALGQGMVLVKKMFDGVFRKAGLCTHTGPDMIAV